MIFEILQLRMASGKPVHLTVSGVSMAPFLQPGDKIFLTRIRSADIRVGHIIGFQQNGALIIHRVVKRKKDGDAWFFCQKGDNLTGWSWIGADQILGRVKKTGCRETGQAEKLIGLAGWSLVTLYEWMTPLKDIFRSLLPTGLPGRMRAGAALFFNHLTARIKR